MKYLFGALILLYTLTCNAQTFSFPFSFWVGDATDTVVVGYAPDATDTLDALYNEQNIISFPYDTPLDVRIGNAWWRTQGPAFAEQSSFETKKQIVPEHCGRYAYSIIELDVVSKNWPVYFTWPRSQFADSCRNKAQATNTSPYLWWFGQGFREYLAINDYHKLYPTNTWYVKGNDTVNVYWFAFGDSVGMYLNTSELPEAPGLFTAYPNPATDQLMLQLPDNTGPVYNYRIFSSTGMLVLSDKQLPISISNLPNGMYLLQAITNHGQTFTTRFVKDE